MDQVDVIVIGAGVVGLSIARALALAGREVIVLESGNAIGQGVSSRNSEVIHAGLYYPPGSLKAALCVRGNALLYEYCSSRGIAHRRSGKLVVATSAADITRLQALQVNATTNGVPASLLDSAQAKALEPALACSAALLSPSTGVVDSHGLMLALQGDFENSGGTVAIGTRMKSADFSRGLPASVVVEADGGELEISARLVVNAAGLQACSLARTFIGLAPAHIPQEYFAKGSYFSLSGRAPFSHLIYPVPEPGGLGVHLTLDIGGQARFGPDVEWIEPASPEQIDYAVEAARGDGFYAEVRKYWPGLKDGSLAPSYSGVRPKIHGPHETAADFRIDGEGRHGVAGLVNLFGIESPGLTSCLAIGEHVREMVAA
ncbi:MAG: NAD(P)/FAD-dependent oxidoreductase [Comamonadaceae bacterium]|nr:MAG: NAD(P)/FAD-dependent oxidoreductase [Comamonadaceae bacterium]